jgi:hypothetical protein
MNNSQNQKSKQSLENTWHCNNCGDRIIPFQKKPGGSIPEGIAMIIGILGIVTGLLGSSEAFGAGVFFLIVGGVIAAWRSSKKINVCPVCESPNIIPSTSPNARAVSHEKARA